MQTSCRGVLMDKRDENLDAALQGIDGEKRATLRRLLVKGAFVTPIVASVAMSGLTVDVLAQAPNATHSRPSFQTGGSKKT